MHAFPGLQSFRRKRGLIMAGIVFIGQLENLTQIVF
jgi:hypothetical protein